MEQKTPISSQGYQKKINKNIQPPPSKKKETHDYSSPIAKKTALFFEAVQSGDLEAVQKFINEKMNVNISHGGITPLLLAVSQGHTAIAEAILQAGANVNVQSEDGWTALHKAAFEQTETDIVNLLMQSGIDIEAKNKARKTALQLAEEQNHHNIVRAIKKHQERLHHDAQEWEEFLNTPEGKPYKLSRLYRAHPLLFNLWIMPIVLLTVGGLLLSYVLGNSMLPIILGVVIGALLGLSLLIVGRMLSAYLEMREPLPYLDIHIVREKRKKGEPIVVEVREKTKPVNDVGTVEPKPAVPATMLSVEESADGLHQEREKIAAAWSRTKNLERAAYAITALIILVSAVFLFLMKDDLAHWYFVKKLERGGMQFTEQSFLDAVSNNNEEALNSFFQAGIPLGAKNEKGQTALIIASEKGLKNLVARLVKMDAGLVRQYDNTGDSALMVAARQGHAAVVQLLIEHGADVNYTVPAREGAASALQTALDAPDFKEAHMNVIRQLLKSGADAKGRNSAGRSPLLFAADHGRWEAAGLLIEKGADVNEADLKGGFPLLIAACKGYDPFVSLLLEKGANLAMTSPDGHTPLMCASQGGHGGTVSILLNKGANANAKTAAGSTALTEATRTGDAAIAQILLERGADHSSGYVPDTFKKLQGRAAAINAKKVKKISDVLGILSKTAVQDGYTISYDVKKMGQATTMKAKGPWNKLLSDLATKNRFVLVMKDKSITILL